MTKVKESATRMMQLLKTEIPKYKQYCDNTYIRNPRPSRSTDEPKQAYHPRVTSSNWSMFNSSLPPNAPRSSDNTCDAIACGSERVLYQGEKHLLPPCEKHLVSTLRRNYDHASHGSHALPH